MFIPKLKLSLLKLIARIFFGDWADPVKHIITSVMVSRPEILNHVTRIRSKEIVEYSFPDRFESFFRRYSLFPERFVYELDEAIVVVGKGVVMTPDNMILLESIGSLRRLLRWEDVRQYVAKRPVPLNLGRTCYFFPQKPFYNFLLEEIPALLYAFEQDPNMVVIVGTGYPQYYHDAFQLIFGDEYVTRLATVDRNVKVAHLLLTQRDSFSNIPHRNDIQLLNHHFHTGYAQTIKRIYISRRKAKSRKIANEYAVEGLLRARGFDILCLEDFPLYEQIRLVGGCEYVVAPHGAGLSHIIWNPALKKTVLEIFPSRIKNDRYACLAKSLDYTYDYLICTREEGIETCNLDHLSRKLAALGVD